MALQNNTPATRPLTISNFFNLPSTNSFLDGVLQEKKPEFVSNLIAMVDGDSNLAACDPAALMKCALNATSLNLPLNKNLGYAYIIPYKGVPSFQIGYKGIIQLAIRTGAYKYIHSTEIREGEIAHNKITGEITFLKDNPSGKVVGYMAYLELLTGFTASLYMTEAKIEEHALKYSKMYASDKQYKTSKSKWSDPEERPKMANKTVLKGLLGTYGLMTTEFARAFEKDDDNAESQPHGRTVEEAELVQQPEPEEKKPEKIQI